MVSTRPPVVNPFDAFGEKQFSSWIGDVTARIQSALNPPEQPYVLPQLPSGLGNIARSGTTQEPEETDDDQVVPHVTLDKGKGRAPDEGPGIAALRRLSSQIDGKHPKDQDVQENGGSSELGSVSDYSDEDHRDAYHDVDEYPQQDEGQIEYSDRSTPGSFADDEDAQGDETLENDMNQEDIVITDLEEGGVEERSEGEEDEAEYEDEEMQDESQFPDVGEQDEIYADDDVVDEDFTSRVNHDTFDDDGETGDIEEDEEEEDGDNPEDRALSQPLYDSAVHHDYSPAPHAQAEYNNYSPKPTQPFLYQVDSSGAIVLSSDSEDGGDEQMEGAEEMKETYTTHHDYQHDMDAREATEDYPNDASSEVDEIEDYDGEVVEDIQGEEVAIGVESTILAQSVINAEPPVEAPIQDLHALSQEILQQFNEESQGLAMDQHSLIPSTTSYEETYTSIPAADADSIHRFSEVVASALSVLEMVNQQVQPLDFQVAGNTDLYQQSALPELPILPNTSEFSTHADHLAIFHQLPTLDPHLSFFAESTVPLQPEISSTPHEIIDVDTLEDHDEAAAAPIAQVPSAVTQSDEPEPVSDLVQTEQQGPPTIDPGSGAGYESDNDDVQEIPISQKTAQRPLEEDPNLDSMVEELPEEDEVIDERVRSAALDGTLHPDIQAFTDIAIPDDSNKVENSEAEDSVNQEVDDGYVAGPESDGRDTGEVIPSENTTQDEARMPIPQHADHDTVVTEAEVEDSDDANGEAIPESADYQEISELSSLSPEPLDGEENIVQSEMDVEMDNESFEVLSDLHQDDAKTRDTSDPPRDDIKRSSPNIAPPQEAEQQSQIEIAEDESSDDPFKHMGTGADGVGGEVEVDETSDPAEETSSSGLELSGGPLQQVDEAEYDDRMDETGPEDHAQEQLSSADAHEYDDNEEIEENGPVSKTEVEESELDLSMLSEDGVDQPEEPEANVEELKETNKENDRADIADDESALGSPLTELMEPDDDGGVPSTNGIASPVKSPPATSPPPETRTLPPLDTNTVDHAGNNDEDDDASFVSSMLSPTDSPTPSVVPPGIDIYRHFHKSGPANAPNGHNQSDGPVLYPPLSTDTNGHIRHSRSSVTSNPNTPVTRSNCRFHKISIPATVDYAEDSKGDNASLTKPKPPLYFIVPGCALSARDVMKAEGIEDCGEATRQENETKVYDLDFVDLYVLGTLRKLVGLDLLNEGQCAYLPTIEELKALRAQEDYWSPRKRAALSTSQSLAGPSRPRKRKVRQSASLFVEPRSKLKEELKEEDAQSSARAESSNLSSPPSTDKDDSESEATSPSKSLSLRPPVSQASTSSLSTAGQHRSRRSKTKGIRNGDKAYQPSGDTESDKESDREDRTRRRRKRTKRSSVASEKQPGANGNSPAKDQQVQSSPRKNRLSDTEVPDSAGRNTDQKLSGNNSAMTPLQRERLKRKSTRDAGSLAHRPARDAESSEEEHYEPSGKRRKKRRRNGSAPGKNRMEIDQDVADSQPKSPALSPTPSATSLPKKMEVEVLIPRQYGHSRDAVEDTGKNV
ncbi:hypothetical protein FRC02_004550 [Tulasnella sp. 418]|nr:hypothetical protein FRC02_004550 [Tulasnella sp. 418]